MLAKILMLAIKFYQITISPYFGVSCRFEPSCSAYAYTSIKRFGAFKGSYLALKRILRCNPLGGCGYDPVPDDSKGSKLV